jgi:xylulose-5-phosphate/fructose-6-phosphate phosphoketolase
MISREPVRAPLTDPELEALDAYWRASLYLCAGMLYLRENPLLKEPLEIGHVKKRLLGHWGSDPGQTLVWTHLSRLIRERDADMIFISGPGHGAPSVLAHAWLEGSYGDVYPDKGQGEEGLRRFFRQFSFPGGIGSHCTPETPGSLHEGGELGYSLAHAFGAAFDHPALIVACMIGDGEAETGPLATAWHSNKFLDPTRDGAVLPILHLNGYKIANPTVLARIDHRQLEDLLRGYGYRPHVVEGDAAPAVHQSLAATLETVMDEIRAIQERARSGESTGLPEWPMIVLRTPKGWTGPREVDGHRVEGFWRAHQIPLDPHRDPAHLSQLEAWLKGYQPERLFTADGRLAPELAELAPRGTRRMSANPVANGGLLRKALLRPDLRAYAVEVTRPGEAEEENTRPLGRLLRDVMRANPTNFRFFCPDETASNRLDDVYQASPKAWMAEILPEDADGSHLERHGRVMEMLSEHTLQGWLEGYLLSGRHGDRLHVQPAREVAGEVLGDPLASAGLGTEHPGDLHGLAPGPQRLLPPGPGVPGPGHQQEPAGHAHLLAAGRQLPALGGRPLPGKHRQDQRHRGRQTAALAVLDPGPGRRALHQGHRHVGMGEQRPGRRAGSGDGLRGRCPHDGGVGRHGFVAPAFSGAQGALRERGGPVPVGARGRARARPDGRRLRQPLHPR